MKAFSNYTVYRAAVPAILLLVLVASSIESLAKDNFYLRKTYTLVQTDTTTKKISASELKKYAGDYVLQSETRTMDVKIFVEDGKLKAHPAGQNVGVMKFVGNHTFIHTKNADIKLVFAIEKGKAAEMTLHQRGKQVSGKRKS